MSAERCDCMVNFLGDEGAEIHPDCGCEGQTCTGTVRIYRDSAWHFEGQHWRAACLIRELSTRLEGDGSPPGASSGEAPGGSPKEDDDGHR